MAFILAAESPAENSAHQLPRSPDINFSEEASLSASVSSSVKGPQTWGRNMLLPEDRGKGDESHKGKERHSTKERLTRRRESHAEPGWTHTAPLPTPEHSGAGASQLSRGGRKPQAGSLQPSSRAFPDGPLSSWPSASHCGDRSLFRIEEKGQRRGSGCLKIKTRLQASQGSSLSPFP